MPKIKNSIPAKKAGRPKAFKSPDELLKIFFEYKNFTKKNPLIEPDYVGRMAKLVYREFERPLTMVGFEVYCCERKIAKELKDYFANTHKAYNNFVEVCARIKTEIRADQIEGGMIGTYNPSITQRLNGLVEKVQEDGSKEIIIKVQFAIKEVIE